MTRRKKRAPERPPPSKREAERFESRLLEYVLWKKARNYSPETIDRVERSIGRFSAWCEERGIEGPAQVTRPMLERYARYLYQVRTATGAPLGFRSQYNELSALRVFFRWLAKQNYVLFSPANDLELPKLNYQLPRTVLTHLEVERVLTQPDITTPAGVRDRAVLETLYSTGVRRMELTRLSLFDVDLARATVMVRQGKGKKDRVVPIGERALDWIERYVSDVRPSFVTDAKEQTLFLTEYGKPMSDDGLSHRVTGYVTAADVGKRGSCHLLRHSMATVMLEQGADVRVIQEILGHSSLHTTQIYTQVSISHLKDVHARTHPSAKRPERANGRKDEPK